MQHCSINSHTHSTQCPSYTSQHQHSLTTTSSKYSISLLQQPYLSYRSHSSTLHGIWYFCSHSYYIFWNWTSVLLNCAKFVASRCRVAIITMFSNCCSYLFGLHNLFTLCCTAVNYIIVHVVYRCYNDTPPTHPFSVFFKLHSPISLSALLQKSLPQN